MKKLGETCYLFANGLYIIFVEFRIVVEGCPHTNYNHVRDGPVLMCLVSAGDGSMETPLKLRFISTSLEQD